MDVSTEPASRSHAPQLRCVLLCDLVDSTGLIDRLGDSRAAELLRRHDGVSRQLIQRHGGREIDKTDGFLVLFERPITAVAFALDYQRALRQLGDDHGVSLRARVGIHVGELLSWENRPEDIREGAKPIEVEGLAKALTARLMSLALPGQILLSETAHALALRARVELAAGERVEWRKHGRYRMQGVATPLPVYEVGEPGLGPLQPPPSRAKARRIVPWWRWRALYAVLAIAALAPAVYQWLQPPPAIAFAERDWVVVADLRNLSAEPNLGEPLQLALRLAIEQSTHVNVLSELSVKGALERMRRPLDKTTIDREVGSEVALRQGARAVILPTLAAVGGRLRFSAELIDPATQTTVHTASLDASSADQLLDSAEQIARQLRGELNESVDRLEQTVPLPQVATASLDALRAYARGRRAATESRLEDALALYRQALEIDPEFDLARLAMAAVRLSQGLPEAALQQLREVEPQRQRLSLRDRMYLDATLSWLQQGPRSGSGKWKLLTELFPDHFPGWANYALTAGDLLQYAEAHRALVETLKAQNPMLASSLMSAASMALLQNQLEPARGYLQQALELGSNDVYNIHFFTAAAARDYPRAEQLVEAVHGVDERHRQFVIHRRRLLLELDRGRWQAAKAALNAELQHTGNVTDEWWAISQLDAMALAELFGDAADDRLLPALSVERQALQSAPASLLERHQFRLFALALWAQRLGRSDLADAAVAVLPDAAALDEQPKLQLLRTLAQAEAKAVAGAWDAALDSLQPWLTGDELIVARSSRLRWLRAAGQHQEAFAAARHLAGLRLRAWAEPGSRFSLQISNLLDVRWAELEAAELALQLGEQRQARQSLDRLLSEAMQEPPPGRFGERIAAVRAALVAAAATP